MAGGRKTDFTQKRSRGRALFGAALLAVSSFLPPLFADAVNPMGTAPIRDGFSDSFTGGKPELEWLAYPHFHRDNLRGAVDPASPEGEAGVGVLDNRNVGGFAALSYAATPPLADFHLEAWLYVQVVEDEKGPLNGIAFHVDPEGNRFYRLAAHFTADPSLSLAYVGKDTNQYPVYLGQWKADSLPGGRPERSGWHRISIDVRDDRAEVYWNGAKLAGGPFHLDRVKAGRIGIYANFTGGLGIAETKIDGLRVRPR
jgi:hypothetical protein